MRVLVFGDSITQGYWDTDGGWVNRARQYYDELQVQDLEGRDEPTVFNLGVSADTTVNILQRIEHETRVRTRHNEHPIVILQIGINDSSLQETTKQIELETYRENLIEIIEKLKPLCSQLIIVGLSACDEAKTMPVSWGEYYYDNISIKNYELAMAEVAERSTIPFIPVFDSFLAAFKKDNSLLPDGLHPNNDGHRIMANIILPQLKELLH